MDSTNERSVYRHSLAIEMKDQRIVAVDSYDNVVALGDKKGYVFPFEERVDGGNAITSKLKFDPLNDGGKRGNSEIQQILYLPRCSMIALLSNSVVVVVQSYDLSSVQEIKTKKVHMFCPNYAVYAADGSLLGDGTQVTRISSQPLMD